MTIVDWRPPLWPRAIGQSTCHRSSLNALWRPKTCNVFDEYWKVPLNNWNFAEFSDKNICHYSKTAWTCHLLCKRPGCHHSASKTHVRDKVFKLTPIHASVIYQIRWIQWIPLPFMKNSIVSVTVSLASLFLDTLLLLNLKCNAHEQNNFNKKLFQLMLIHFSNNISAEIALMWTNLAQGNILLRIINVIVKNWASNSAYQNVDVYLPRSC